MRSIFERRRQRLTESLGRVVDNIVEVPGDLLTQRLHNEGGVVEGRVTRRKRGRGKQDPKT